MTEGEEPGIPGLEWPGKPEEEPGMTGLEWPGKAEEEGSGMPEEGGSGMTEEGDSGIPEAIGQVEAETRPSDIAAQAETAESIIRPSVLYWVQRALIRSGVRNSETSSVRPSSTTKVFPAPEYL